MAHDNKGVSKEEAIRRRFETGPVQLEDTAAASEAEKQNRRQPAQVRPDQQHPAAEDVPPGNLGPPEGPGS